MRSIAALGLLALAGLSATQDVYNINPDDVSPSDRQTWCDNQKASCPLICLQQPDVESMTTISNDCDPDTLEYSCVCENNIAPNLTEFSQTIPYYECTEWGNQCVNACSDDTCKFNCRSQHPCGAQTPYKGNGTTLSSTMASTAAPTGSATNSIPVTGLLGATATAGPNGQGAASAMLNLGQSYGLAVIFAGVFAGFALIL